MVDVIKGGVRYMFIPDCVAETLREFPTLAAELGDPAEEGSPAMHFEQARTTPRQMYRLLTASHMQHILDLLRRIEFTFTRGWRDDQLLTTSSHAQMRGGIAETLVVESLILAGFEIEPVPRDRGRSPDIRARTGDVRALVEVYTPRTWEGLFDFVDDAKDWLIHLDEPYDFNFNFDMQHIRLFDERGFARWFNAFEFSISVEQQLQRLIRLAPVLDEARRRLEWGVPTQEVIGRDDDLDIQISLSLSSIRPAQHELPARQGVLGPPALSGYAPEGIFENMLRKGLRKKLERGQGASADELAVLAVDISHLQIESELSHAAYQRLFMDALERRVALDDSPYDLVLFVLPSRKPQRGLSVVFSAAHGERPAAPAFVALAAAT